ncbi:Cysteine proteinase, putative [Hondaea fermentalgiana]|uniref:Cysteine proteinase, putative n=1 Tax=Hondaea fermentalgiana TaxID=2315210 RepID=A0A2R5G707_9STRA|nr:Cysteine proteinase, putative [Hondaea fermentalgiana]|eukprot:GBG26837.1 Cysteine proteinase, putative [Hondaea fermentalgiana]
MASAAAGVREVLEAVLSGQDEDAAREKLLRMDRASDLADRRRARRLVEKLLRENRVEETAVLGPPGSWRRRLRERIVLENLAFIEDFNARQSSARLDSDSALLLLDHDEFAQTMSQGLLEVDAATPEANNTDIVRDTLPSERTWDWREHGAVGHVRHQGNCGSCWAHATAAVVEGRMAIDEQRLYQLSARQIVECFRPEAYGCRGGSFINALRSYTQHHALDTEETWASAPVSAASCPTGLDTISKDRNGVVLTKGVIDSKEIRSSVSRMATLVRQQPVASSMIASSRCLQFYAQGILDDVACAASSSSDIKHGQHAVAIVGFENLDDPERSAWIVMNSWGRHKLTPYDDGSEHGRDQHGELIRNAIVGTGFALWILTLVHESLNRLLEGYEEEIDDENDGIGEDGAENGGVSRARPYDSSII